MASAEWRLQSPRFAETRILYLVVSGDSSLAACSNPPLTCVDVDLELHIQLAGGMLSRALAGALPPTDRLRLIEPRLIERASVAPPPIPA